MTEREKMLSGELYDPTDKELEQLRVNARKLARKYNSTDEDDQEEQAQILRELLTATEELPYLQAPVYFDYGCNTFFGRFSSANFNFTCLDVCGFRSWRGTVRLRTIFWFRSRLRFAK